MKIFLCAAFALILAPLCARAIPVTVRVADAAGAPIAGATVNYLDYATINRANGDFPLSLSKTTATDGTLALEVKGASRSRDFDAGDVTAFPNLGGARVSAPGYGYALINLVAGENAVTLRRGVSLNGIIRDENGVALAGAKVHLQSVEPDSDRISDAFTGWIVAPIEALTDQNGAWKMTDLPRGRATIQVLAPNQVAGDLSIALDHADNAAPPLKLEAAGTVSGRILDRDGHSLAGVYVRFPDQSADIVSDEAGRFVLQGVPLEKTELNFFGTSVDWLGVDETVTATVPAKSANVDVGEVRTGEGLLISGTLRDKKSGAVLSHLELRSLNARFQTDAAGHFEARVWGANFGGLGLPNGYTLASSIATPPAGAKNFDLGEVAVERTVDLPLDLRDENGAPAPMAKVRFQSTNLPDATHQRDSANNGEGIRVRALPAADYAIEGLGLWQVIAPQTTAVAPGAAPAPLTIRVHQLEAPRVSGRVIDERGQALADARVKIGWTGDWRNVSALSGSDGTWSVELPDALATPVFDKAELAPFVFVRGAELRREGETKRWHAADIVLARTDIALVGRVVDADGAAVSGARVSWEGAPNFDFAATDDKGNFTLQNVPAVPTSVWSVSGDGARFAAATATPGTPVALKLPPANAPLSDADSDKLWEQESVKNLWNLGDYFDVLGAARIYQAARRLDAAQDPTQIGSGLSFYLRMRANHARTSAERFDVAVEGVELLHSIPINDVSGDAAAKIAILAARTDDAELRAWAAGWYESRQPRMPQKLDASYYSDSNLLNIEFQMSAVGAALGRPNAEKYRADGLELMRNYHNGEPRFYLTSWGALLWDSDPKRFDEALATWPKTEQMKLFVGALEKVEDASQAKILFAQLENLSNDATVLADEAAAKEKDKYSWSPREQSLYEGRINYARAVATVDAPAALDALEKIGNAPEACKNAVGIARAALVDGRTELARRALSLGLKGNYGNTSGTFALAMVARDFDAKLAIQLLDRFRASVLADESGRSENNRDKGWRDVAAYAFTLHDFDAGMGRLLLEEQWAKRRDASPAVQSDYESWAAVNEQENLAWAMAIYDLPRALQWLGEIKDERDEYNNRLELTRIAILALASATPMQRLDLLATRNFN